MIETCILFINFGVMPLLLRTALTFCLFFIAGNLLAGNDGGKDSAVVIYYENGKIKEEGNLRNGERHGKWNEYDTNGWLVRITKYKNGSFRWQKEYKEGKLIQVTDRKGRVHKRSGCGC